MTTEHEMAVAMTTEIGKQVPVKQAYDDAASPAAKQIGAILEDVVKCIRIVGFPIQWLAVQQDRYRSFIEKAKNPIPEERRVLPVPQILGPILEGVKYEFVETSVVELFQNSLGSAMDKDTLHLVHPSYVGIIKSLAPDEAKILRHLVGQRLYCIDIAEGLLHIGSEGVSLYQVEPIALTYPENAELYIEHLFTHGLITWDHTAQGVVEYEGKRVGQSALMLSKTGLRMMQACRIAL